MKNILLLLANGFEIFEAIAFIDVMGWNLLEGDKSTKLSTCALTKQVRSTFDQPFVVGHLLSEINLDEYAALAIPGGFEEYGFYVDAYSTEFSELIVKFNLANKPIPTICTGAFPVTKSGVLLDRRATTYNKNPARQEALSRMGVQLVNAPMVVDRNIITSWNPSTAIDVALYLLEVLTTKENAISIKNLMGFKDNENR